MAAGVLGVIGAGGSASALAAVSPPTLVSAFGPTAIAVNGTSTLSFTITNPNASTLNGVGLADTLPAGLVVDSPSGQSGTCGSNGVLTATSGGNSITLTGGKLSANTNCVVSVNVTAATPGSYQNNSVGATSTEGGTGTGDTQTLSVFALPTLAITTPKNKATFSFGQKVKLSFTCTDGTGAPGINDCEADDDDTGATYTSGQALDTTTPGKHTVTFLAVSNDAGQTSQDLTYTVQPDNHFTVSTPKPGPHGKLSFGLKLPGAGAISIVETEAGGKHATIAATTTSVHGAKTLHVELKPNAAGQQILAALRSGSKASGAQKSTKTKAPALAAKLTISFTPKHGVKNTTTVKGIALKA
jgi:hypothetical protein